MRHFFVYIYLIIILVFGWNPSVQASFKNEIQTAPVEQRASDNDLYSFLISDYHNNALTEESCQNTIPSSPRTIQKFPFSEAFTEKIIEQSENDKISDYLFITECRTIRLEDPDIIHPFNYFW